MLRAGGFHWFSPDCEGSHLLGRAYSILSLVCQKLHVLVGGFEWHRWELAQLSLGTLQPPASWKPPSLTLGGPSLGSLSRHCAALPQHIFLFEGSWPAEDRRAVASSEALPAQGISMDSRAVSLPVMIGGEPALCLPIPHFGY